MAVRDGASGDGQEEASGNDDRHPTGSNPPASSGAVRRGATEADKSDEMDGDRQPDLVEGWIKRLRSRKLTASLILVVVIIGAAAGVVNQVTGKSPLDLYRQVTEPEPSYEPPSEDEWHDVESRPPPALAYRTDESIYIAPDGREPELLFTFAPASTGYSNNQLFWSPEGRYLGALVHTETGRIAWYFDTATGEQGKWGCECSGAAFVGSLLVAVESTQLNVKRFDIDASPTTVELDWPDEEPASWSYVLSAAEGGLLLGAPTHLGGLTSAYGGPSSVYMVDLHGKASRLYDLPGNTAVNTAAIAPGGRVLAVVTTSHLNACYESQEIVAVNAANGSERPIPFPTDEAWVVSSVAWDSGGNLWATMLAFGSRISDLERPDASYSCSAGIVGRVHVLRGASWTVLESPPIEATELSAGPNADVAFIGPYKSPDRVNERWGDLSVLTAADGEVHALDDGVIQALWSSSQGETEGLPG